VQQHGVLWTDVDARGFLCRIKISDADVALERLVRQVKANRLVKKFSSGIWSMLFALGFSSKWIGASIWVPEWSPMFSEVTADENV